MFLYLVCISVLGERPYIGTVLKEDSQLWAAESFVVLGLLLVSLHKCTSEPAAAHVLCSSPITGEGWLEINPVAGKSWVLWGATSDGVRY